MDVDYEFFVDQDYSAGFRCTNRSDCTRPRIRNPHLAFTPFYGHANAARDPDWVMFARYIYALGCKLPNDAATHMVRRTQDSVRGTEDLVGRIYSKLKISLAYSEEMRAKQDVIQHGVVEPDSAQAGIRRAANPTQKEIRGRTLEAASAKSGWRARSHLRLQRKAEVWALRAWRRSSTQ